MIARFKVLLPYSFYIPIDECLSSQSFDHRDYQVFIFPPIQAKAKYADLGAIGPKADQVLEGLVLAEPQIVEGFISIKGKQVVESNLLQIDFKKDAFNRDSREQNPRHYDPPLPLAFGIANSFLARVRTITQDSGLRTLHPSKTAWQIKYLTDNEEPVDDDSSGRRCTGRASAGGTFAARTITTEVWEKIAELPGDYQPYAWETLILDAIGLLPDANAAVVLAAAALETFIGEALNKLQAQSQIPNELWTWLNNRGHFLKDPSVEEQFGILLKFFTGWSLEEDTRLWESFQYLRAARNSLAHEGILSVSKKNKKKEKLTLERAIDLVHIAKEIIERVETFLPEQERRDIPDLSTLQFDITHRMQIPTPGSSSEFVIGPQG